MGRRNIGPGPGKYLLPPLTGFTNHDPSKYRNPNYSMGIKTPFIGKEKSPGPKYMTEHMTEYGRDEHPAYSLVSRPEPLKAFRGPGPAAYNLQDAPRMKDQRPPAYSIADRHELRKAFHTPGPNVYGLPTTLGPKVPDKHANPGYSMSSKYPLTTKAKSPGPARYDPTAPNSYRNKLPIYSMSAKHELSVKPKSPGPSAYYPLISHGDGYSFGLKTDTSPYITPEDEMPCINK